MKTKNQSQDVMRLLVSLDAGYLDQLCVLLVSIAVNDPTPLFELYLLHSSLTEEELQRVEVCCRQTRMIFHPIRVGDDLFSDAPASRRYPKEMYYRLLAGELLPEQVDKALYLDPDILVINPLCALWEMELGDVLFAAGSHTGKTELSNNVNRLRLKTDHDYYNSGVLLIDLKRCREQITPETLFQYVRTHENELLLPDQDVLNALYGKQVLPINDALWNYDARNYQTYLLRSGGARDLSWVMANTSILHFCGKAKPWKPGYPYRFGLLYRHYMQITQRWMEQTAH